MVQHACCSALHGLPHSHSQENTLIYGNQYRVPYGQVLPLPHISVLQQAFPEVSTDHRSDQVQERQ